jgi:hypothetical protein
MARAVRIREQNVQEGQAGAAGEVTRNLLVGRLVMCEMDSDEKFETRFRIHINQG